MACVKYTLALTYAALKAAVDTRGCCDRAGAPSLPDLIHLPVQLRVAVLELHHVVDNCIHRHDVRVWRRTAIDGKAWVYRLDYRYTYFHVARSLNDARLAPAALHQ